MLESDTVKRFDALVVGGGIAGLQTALDLADQLEKGWRHAVPASSKKQ